MKAVIFDLDGTLQSLEIDFRALRQDLAALFDRSGHPLADGPILEAIEASLGALGEKGLTPAQVGRIRLQAGRLMDRAELSSYPKVRTFPGVPQMLSQLGRRGVRTAVLSRACRAYVDRSLDRIGHPFAAVIAREDVLRPKPDPEGILLLLVKLGAPPADCAVVGDHPFDVTAGKKAGTRAAGVLTGVGTKEMLMDAGADAVFERAGPELVDWLDGSVHPHG
jgi:phosphoglycolate phosphatase-like HAD superfamily hydrolase